MADTDGWDERAKDWIERSEIFDAHVQPLTDAMLATANLEPGQRVLELACGPGGMIPLLAKAVSPGGEVVGSDISPKMVAGAARLIESLGIQNAVVREMGLDWLDAPSAVADRIICRFGYMFATDLGSALHEARRVLKPGGRLVAAVWADPSVNPYGAMLGEALEMIGFGKRSVAGDPGMFRLANRDAFIEEIYSAGFIEVSAAEVEIAFRFGSTLDFLEWVCGVSQTVANALKDGGPDAQTAFDAAIESLVLNYVDGNGSLELPGVVTLVTADA